MSKMIINITMSRYHQKYVRAKNNYVEVIKHK